MRLSFPPSFCRSWRFVRHIAHKKNSPAESFTEYNKIRLHMQPGSACSSSGWMMHLKRQVFWLMVLPRMHLPAAINATVANCIFVPKYSSGTAPDLHRLPFSIRLYRRIPQKAFYKLVWVYHRKQRFSTLCFPSLNSYKTYGIIEIYRRYNCSNENFH